MYLYHINKPNLHINTHIRLYEYVYSKTHAIWLCHMSYNWKRKEIRTIIGTHPRRKIADPGHDNIFIIIDSWCTSCTHSIVSFFPPLIGSSSNSHYTKYPCYREIEVSHSIDTKHQGQVFSSYFTDTDQTFAKCIWFLLFNASINRNNFFFRRRCFTVWWRHFTADCDIISRTGVGHFVSCLCWYVQYESAAVGSFKLDGWWKFFRNDHSPCKAVKPRSYDKSWLQTGHRHTYVSTFLRERQTRTENCKEAPSILDSLYLFTTSTVEIKTFSACLFWKLWRCQVAMVMRRRLICNEAKPTTKYESTNHDQPRLGFCWSQWKSRTDSVIRDIPTSR